VLKIGAEGEGPATDVMEINRLGDLAYIANQRLALAETKKLLTGLQQDIVAAQVRDHADRNSPPTQVGSASGWIMARQPSRCRRFAAGGTKLAASAIPAPSAL